MRSSPDKNTEVKEEENKESNSKGAPDDEVTKTDAKDDEEKKDESTSPTDVKKASTNGDDNKEDPPGQNLTSDNPSGQEVVQPNPHDVLLGRGKPFQNHHGNQEMLRLVDMYRQRYHQAERSYKHEIIEQVLNTIRSNGGRFLERVDERGRSYFQTVSHSIAYRKIGHAFRSNARMKAAKRQLQANLNNPSMVAPNRGMPPNYPAMHMGYFPPHPAMFPPGMMPQGGPPPGMFPPGMMPPPGMMMGGQPPPPYMMLNGYAAGNVAAQNNGSPAQQDPEKPPAGQPWSSSHQSTRSPHRLTEQQQAGQQWSSQPTRPPDRPAERQEAGQAWPEHHAPAEEKQKEGDD